MKIGIIGTGHIGATTEDDASRACAALQDCRIERVDTGHSFHDENPRLFVELIRQLRDDVA